MHVAAPVCGLVRRCEHHTGRSAYPKPTRSRSAQPSSKMLGACASQPHRLFARVGTLRPRETVKIERAMPWEAPDGSLACPFHSSWPSSKIGPAKVLCRVPERSHYHVDCTRAPHGMTQPSQAPPVHLRQNRYVGCCSIASSMSRKTVQSYGRRRGGANTFCESSMAASWR